MFEYWSWFILAFLGFICLGYLIYYFGNKSKKPEGKKSETYTCGEPFPKVSVKPENFYQAIRKGLAFERLRNIQSGKLSDYLLWIIIGIVVVLLLIIWV
jgi:flagellar basal body-associated protein FliL